MTILNVFNTHDMTIDTMTDDTMIVEQINAIHVRESTINNISFLSSEIKHKAVRLMAQL